MTGGCYAYVFYPSSYWYLESWETSPLNALSLPLEALAVGEKLTTSSGFAVLRLVSIKVTPLILSILVCSEIYTKESRCVRTDPPCLMNWRLTFFIIYSELRYESLKL